MDYSWQGSDNRKLSMLKDLYGKELDNNKELSSMSVEEQTLYKKWQEWNQDLKHNCVLLPTLPSSQADQYTANR